MPQENRIIDMHKVYEIILCTAPKYHFHKNEFNILNVYSYFAILDRTHKIRNIAIAKPVK